MLIHIITIDNYVTLLTLLEDLEDLEHVKDEKNRRFLEGFSKEDPLDLLPNIQTSKHLYTSKHPTGHEPFSTSISS